MDPTSQPFCIICLDSIQPAQLTRLLPCKHVFCGSCITKWLAKSGNCPICTQPVKAAIDPSGQEVLIEKAKPEPEETKEESFECLDRCFFETEFEKVLVYIQAAQKEVRFRFGSSSEKCKEVLKKLQELKTAVLDELDFLKDSLESLDPKYELSALVRSTEIIAGCKRGELFSLSLEEAPKTTQSPESLYNEDSFPVLNLAEEPSTPSLIDQFEPVQPKKKGKNKKKAKKRGAVHV